MRGARRILLTCFGFLRVVRDETVLGAADLASGFTSVFLRAARDFLAAFRWSAKASFQAFLHFFARREESFACWRAFFSSCLASLSVFFALLTVRLSSSACLAEACAEDASVRILVVVGFLAFLDLDFIIERVGDNV